MEVFVLLLIAVAAIAALLALFMKHRELKEDYRRATTSNKQLQERFGPVIDLEGEVEKVRRERDKQVQAFDSLRSQYDQSKGIYDKLKKEVGLLEENLEDISVGLYKPHFDFKTSESYRQKLEQIREQQKVLVRAGEAAIFSTTWTVGGSAKDGQRMQKQYSKLMLRAFNGECDAAIAKVAWNNVTRMEERIQKAFEALNDLGGVMNIHLTRPFMDLRLNELRLEYEMEQKKQDELDEQRRIKEQMREEERAQREFEKARQDAEDEEKRYEKALEKARKEMEKAKGAQVADLNGKIVQLEEQLRLAQESKQRALAQAQLTKSGHVYVISNIGSFGENVFKIGMTRRLDPMDRVYELGDASVPFEFDVHAMISSSDAPTLENRLHQHFSQKRVNLVNHRKEFFHIAVDEIVEFALKHNIKIEITKLGEAKEYRETLAMREKRLRESGAQKVVEFREEFPDELIPRSGVF